MKSLQELQIPEVLEFRRDEGQIWLHEQRVLVISAAALGLLRKELIATLGRETARRVMLRFGWADGYHDAISLRDHFNWDEPLEWLRAGPALHTLEGLVHAEMVRADLDPDTRRFEAEVVWRQSYEAEQHLHHCGPQDGPACWSLVGYASGYASACLGAEVYFDEQQCLGAGASCCTIVGRDAASWGEALARFRFDYRGADLAAQVERLRAIVHKRREALARHQRQIEEHARELDALRERVARHARSKRFVAVSAGMQEVLEAAARVAPLDTTVLVCGESGTGKEFVVRMIHEQSPRAQGPLVSVNCAALTETLLESELFGHVRGAFTGAMRDKRGLFEIATDGTLFLDEVGEMTAGLQAKLLRALQEQEIRPVGGERSITVNPRVVAATNRDLRAAVDAGAFREDLYFRLGGFIITVPPLRDRREAIPVLAQEFLRRAAARFKKDVRAVSPDAMSLLIDYAWPGNVRELEHAVQRAVILAKGTRITPKELPPEFRSRRRIRPAIESFDLARHERNVIEQALEHFGGNRRRAARALNISAVTLWRKMKRYRMEAPPDGDDE